MGKFSKIHDNHYELQSRQRATKNDNEKIFPHYVGSICIVPLTTELAKSSTATAAAMTDSAAFKTHFPADNKPSATELRPSII